MAYTALYRKFRPVTFEGVIGQEHIIRSLKNQISSERVSHAYLFCGTRGTGKTSTAKIFAKAINCLNPSNGEPCGQCDMCKAIEEGRSINVIEIDAASNNGVDSIREIREEVKYPPTEGKYKVYIIDEVHMLSQGAYNALLKTLEEPPEHVVFILATTDPQKVPATIHSRCQRFDFKRITSGEIAKTLHDYIEKENADIDESALHYIATLADGSMRDSLSILDQCMAFYYNEKITLEKVLSITGAVNSTVFFDITDAIVNKNISGAMDIIDDIINAGRDIKQFTDGLIVHFRNLLIALTVNEADVILDMSEENALKLKKQSNNISSDELIYLIKIFSVLQQEMRYAPNPRILLEVEIIKISAPSVKNDFTSIMARIASVERQIKNGIVSVNEKPAKSSEKKISVKKERPKALPEDIREAIDIWEDMRTNFNVIIAELLKECFPGYMEDNRLAIVCSNKAIEKLIKERVPKIKEAFDTRLKKDFDIKTITKDEFKAWERMTYGEPEEGYDPEFESLMSSFIPDMEIEE